MPCNRWKRCADHHCVDAPEKYKCLTTYRMRATVLGREATTVIVYNPELEKGQLQEIQINIEKTKSELLGKDSGGNRFLVRLFRP